MNIEKQITSSVINFYYRTENSLSSAEASLFPSFLALNYLSHCDISELEPEVNKIKRQLENNQVQSLFFNRLFVHQKNRNQGVGENLLRELILHAKTNNLIIINTVNAYGDLSHNELVSFYQKHGMTLVHSEGLMLYSSVFDAPAKKRKRSF